MKYLQIILSFLVLTLLSQSLFSQTDSAKYVRGIVVNSNINNTGFNVSINSIFRKEKHLFYLGVKFPISKRNGAETGLNTGYQYFPGRISRRFDLFFFFDLQSSREIGIYYSGDNIFSVGKGVAIYNTIGYGFNLNLTDYIYINHCLGGGLKSFWITDGKYYCEPAVLLSLGLGFNF